MRDFTTAFPCSDSITLRSANGDDVVVSQMMLSVHSTVFRDMLASGTDDGVPVVLAEETACLEIMLSCVHGELPPAGPAWAEVVKATVKYDMQLVKGALLHELA